MYSPGQNVFMFCIFLWIADWIIFAMKENGRRDRFQKARFYAGFKTVVKSNKNRRD